MIIRLLRRYIVKKSSRFLAVAGVLLFVFQTGPVYCGACIPGNCGHGESAFRLAGNDDCHKAVQTNECCKNKPEKKLRDGEYGVDDCTSCDCSFKGKTENRGYQHNNKRKNYGGTRDNPLYSISRYAFHRRCIQDVKI